MANTHYLTVLNPNVHQSPAAVCEEIMGLIMTGISYRIKGGNRATAQARWDARKEKRALQAVIGASAQEGKATTRRL